MVLIEYTKDGDGFDQALGRSTRISVASSMCEVSFSLPLSRVCLSMYKEFRNRSFHPPLIAFRVLNRSRSWRTVVRLVRARLSLFLFLNFTR